MLFKNNHLPIRILSQKAQPPSEAKPVNDNDRGTFKPAPSAGTIQCPKCKVGVMVSSPKAPTVSVCRKCGHMATRVALK